MDRKEIAVSMLQTIFETEPVRKVHYAQAQQILDSDGESRPVQERILLIQQMATQSMSRHAVLVADSLLSVLDEKEDHI